MKKVFLSLAVIAALTVVSCKEKAAEAPVDETPAVEAPVVEETPAVDTTAAPVADTTATPEVKK